MAGIKDKSVGRKDIFQVKISDIKLKPGWNARIPPPSKTDEDIVLLSRAIAKRTVTRKDGTIGVDIAPIVIDCDGELTDGHRRLLAIDLANDNGANIYCVPAETESRNATEADKVTTMLIRSGGGSKPLSPLEMGSVVKRLIDLGQTKEEVAENIGKTTQYIHKLLDIQAMPEELKKQVSEGIVSASTALDEHKSSGEQAAGNINEAAEEAEKKTGKKKVTKKNLKKKPTMPPENKALEVIEKWAYKYTQEVEDKIYDLCNELNNLLVDGNLNEHEDD